MKIPTQKEAKDLIPSVADGLEEYSQNTGQFFDKSRFLEYYTNPTNEGFALVLAHFYLSHFDTGRSRKEALKEVYNLLGRKGPEHGCRI